MLHGDSPACGIHHKKGGKQSLRRDLHLSSMPSVPNPDIGRRYPAYEGTPEEANELVDLEDLF